MASKRDLLHLLNKEMKRAGYPGLKGKKLFLLRRNSRRVFENLLSELKVKKGDLIANCETGNLLVHEILWNPPHRYWLPFLEIKDIIGNYRCGCSPISPPKTYEEIFENQKEWLEEETPNLLKHGYAFFDEEGIELEERDKLEKLFAPTKPVKLAEDEETQEKEENDGT